MRISLFKNFGALNSVPVFDALKQGFDALNIATTTHDMTADVAVIWSMVWAGRMKSNQQVWQEFRKTKRPVIVLEVGMLQRGQTWKVAVNGVNGDAHWGQEQDPNRVLQFSKLIHPWRQSGQHILIAAQRTDSAQWQGQSSSWLKDTVDQLKLHTTRDIVIRQHPRERINHITGCIVQKPQAIPGTYDDFNFNRALQNCWAVINWNSGPGTQAILSGVPAFVGPSSLALPVANTDLSQIENPAMPSREQWFRDLVHTEWTVEEIKTGYPISRLLPALQNHT